jgi:hypothetical protein
MVPQGTPLQMSFLLGLSPAADDYFILFVRAAPAPLATVPPHKSFGALVFLRERWPVRSIPLPWQSNTTADSFGTHRESFRSDRKDSPVRFRVVFRPRANELLSRLFF